MAAAPTEPMASEGSNFEVVIEKRLPSSDFEVIPEEDEIKPDHYYEDGGIPVFKPVSSAARSFCCFVLVSGRGVGEFSEVSRIAGRTNGSREGKPCNGFEC